MLKLVNLRLYVYKSLLMNYYRHDNILGWAHEYKPVIWTTVKAAVIEN